MKYLTDIDFVLPSVNRRIKIKLDETNLIITGGNGSGKTTFVKELYKKLRQIIIQDSEGQLRSAKHDREQHIQYITNLKSQPHYELQIRQTEENIARLNAKIAELEAGPNVDIKNYLDFRKYVLSGKGLVELFDANRQAQIDAATGADTASYDRQDLTGEGSDRIGGKFEKHLVNLRTRRSFAITEENDAPLAKKIDDWFAQLESDLRVLFEDESTRLVFDPAKFKYFISQTGRMPYTFQTLSSGYSSIFHIISRLLMRSEYLAVSPAELTGIAIIDEIDAHLHVSLQRKIFPFLTKTFPNIQYIVTTHSPFILGSVSDALIYDITTAESGIDISSYSYDAILETVFNVPTTSDILRDKIVRLAAIIEEKVVDTDEIKKILSSIGDNSDLLDEESAYYIGKAKLALVRGNVRSAEDV
jgi:predicted ATPase